MKATKHFDNLSYNRLLLRFLNRFFKIIIINIDALFWNCISSSDQLFLPDGIIFSLVTVQMSDVSSTMVYSNLWNAFLTDD